MHFLKKLTSVRPLDVVSCALVCFAVLSGCSAKQGELVVATVGKSAITLKEYEDLYLKSSGSREQAAATTQEERERFLDLLTRFKLKLNDAYDQKLDQRPEIRNEIEQYKGSLVASFLTEREVNAPGVRKMYDSRKNEVRASHILLNLSSTPSPEDSQKAYALAYDLIARLRAGASFESLAVAYSNDPSVSQNKGDLYYFTGGQMVPEFEEAAFAMKPGEISTKPVRTSYGLHIIKLVDRKPSPGEIKCSHIMIRFDKQNPTPEDTLAAYEKIKAIQDSLRQGVDFAELAIRNSQDPGSAPRGGDLGWFSRRRWIQSFDEVAFTLTPGQVSNIVRTIYGYHLIKCYDARPMKSFEEARKDMQQLFQQTRFQAEYNKFLDRIKKQVQYSRNDSILNILAVSFDSTKTTRDSGWTAMAPKELAAQPVFRFGQRTISADSMLKLAAARPDMGSMPLTSNSIRMMADKVGEQLIFQVRGETIEKDYPEFAAIMKEYVDGILLYQIEQERVWGRVTVNDSLLQAYFQANRNKFMWPDRVDFTSAQAANDSLARLISEKIKSGKSMEEVFAEDSVRTRVPSRYLITFAKSSAVLNAAARTALASLARELKSDPAWNVVITLQYDTTGRKAANERLAKKRRDAIKTVLTGSHSLAESRITFTLRGVARDTTRAKQLDTLFDRASAEITGKRPWFVGAIEHGIQPVTADERTARADSLQVGQYSAPFPYRGYPTIVRLNKRDPLREKTYEEAGTEVSSSYQEYESKRLENEWLNALQTKYPVVVYKERLKYAFVPAQ
jgi:peptidyl-prolyl cis-trans isomerase SurA